MLKEAVDIDNEHDSAPPSSPVPLIITAILGQQQREEKGVLARCKDNSGTFSRIGGLGNFIKDHSKRSTGDKKRLKEQKSDTGFNRATPKVSTDNDSQLERQQKWPPFRNTPRITFQPHSTEISTDRPSVSGRLVLHIPRLPGLKFHFVSLALHLRLKESISWTRQDLVSFEIEKHHWAQTVWDKKMMLPFQDKQVGEGGQDGFGHSDRKGLSSAGAVATAASVLANPDTSTVEQTGLPEVVSNQHGSSKPKDPAECPAASTGAARGVIDEWRWEWLMPVTKKEARPESFEGCMGMVWYELEAKCLFRWDKVDKDGRVLINGDLKSTSSTQASMNGKSTNFSGLGGGMAKSQSGSNNLLKGLGVSTNKSIAQVFDKLRRGNKNKKTQFSGDFKMATQHEEYIKNSLKKANEAALASAASQVSQTTDYSVLSSLQSLGETGQALNNQRHPLETPSATTTGAVKESRQPASPEPIPFLMRKTLKLYFHHPPPKTSSNPAFFLPPPSMSLPNLPSTRRLKAIIPGARIQVQIEVPSIIFIPGYAQTSRLVPCSKTGVLIPLKKSDSSLGNNGSTIGSHVGNFGSSGVSMNKKVRSSSKTHAVSPRPTYLDNFQVALTVRKVTQNDINKSDILRRRYENVEVAANAVNNSVANGSGSGRLYEGATQQGSTRTRQLSHQSNSNISSAAVHATSATAVQGCGGDPNDAVSAALVPSSGLTCSAAMGTRQKSGRDKTWRKEIRVRKVKCEFWQKESCRIPSDIQPSRSVKVSLGPVFSYSEKDQEKERLHNGSTQLLQHRATASWDANGPTMATTEDSSSPPPLLKIRTTALAAASIRKKCSPSSPLSPALSERSDLGPNGNSPLKIPSRLYAGKSRSNRDIERKGSLGSIVTSPLFQASSAPQQHHQQQHPTVIATPTHTLPNKPFTVLIPVLLNSPKLRQTYAWPSFETQSQVHTHSAPKSLPKESSDLSFGSELDCQSRGTTYEMVGSEEGISNGGSSAHTNNHAYNNQHHTSSTPAVKARIEVKHYLTFRLSIDVLEYEGELEQEDVDLEAIEEPQLQQASARQHQEFLPVDGEDFIRPTKTSQTSSSAPILTPSQSHDGSKSMVSSPTSPKVGTGSEPALSFLNSTAGLLDMDLTGPSALPPGAGSLGVVYNLSKRRESRSSSGTVKSGQSEHGEDYAGTVGIGAMTATAANAPPVTGNGNPGGGSSGGGLITGAIGAIKKKASGSALANIHYNHQQQQQQQRRNSRVSVQKLKDFVIRVPITVVVQADEHGQVTGAFGRTSSRDASKVSGDSHIDTVEHHCQAYSGAVPALGANVTSTATTTIGNIVTVSSSGRPEESIDPLESTGTLTSMNSIAVSAGPEPVVRRMEDFTSTLSLRFAGRKNHQGENTVGGPLQCSQSSSGTSGRRHQRQRSGLAVGAHGIEGREDESDSGSEDGERGEGAEEEFVVIDVEEMEEYEATERTSTKSAKVVLSRIAQL
ncbi:hypothetical protein BGZ58_007706 [Dissophora ornata]|nr:hypothetical protein BGZ58_007706 [Dissophora ornata]